MYIVYHRSSFGRLSIPKYYCQLNLLNHLWLSEFLRSWVNYRSHPKKKKRDPQLLVLFSRFVTFSPPFLVSIYTVVFSSDGCYSSWSLCWTKMEDEPNASSQMQNGYENGAPNAPKIPGSYHFWHRVIQWVGKLMVDIHKKSCSFPFRVALLVKAEVMSSSSTAPAWLSSPRKACQDEGFSLIFTPFSS